MRLMQLNYGSGPYLRSGALSGGTIAPTMPRSSSKIFQLNQAFDV